MKNNWIRATILVALYVFAPVGNGAFACPHFVEFFSDPKDVPDQEGEFVEIRLDDFLSDSLRVQMDEKTPLALTFPMGRRLVLVHDSAFCPPVAEVACGLLGKMSLPNSRESLWKLQAGSCGDSVLLPTPKAGMSLQRVRETDSWEFTEPTMGLANPYFEEGVRDCGIEPVESLLLDGSGNAGSRWEYSLSLTGCDSSVMNVDVLDLRGNVVVKDSLVVRGRYGFESSADGVWIRARLPADEASSNDSIDTLMIMSHGAAPVVISEIHHCPQEPEPEWVEVYNRSGVSLPLKRFGFCNRGGGWGDGLLDPYETVVLTRDTATLREVLGFKDVRLGQVAFGYLNNTSGCISICDGETVMDSVCWDRHTVSCPAGFNPLEMSAENTPGFIRAKSLDKSSSALADSDAPFSYRLSSRVLRLGGNPLRVFVESESVVQIRLLDSTGRELWRMDAPAQSNTWWNVPLDRLNVGVAYVSFSVGKFENVVGILIRK